MLRSHREAHRRRTHRSNRTPRRTVRLAIDALESRTLLSSVSWTGKGDGKTWTDASNWSGDAVPGASDDVTINLTGNPTIQITSGNQSVDSVTSSDPLSISGGSLAVAANSTLSGGLNMTGGSLTAMGSGVTLTVTGTTSVSAASLYAQNGATLRLLQLTSYANPDSYHSTYLEATGAGAVLSLPALAGLGALQSNVNLQATQGGQVLLPALADVAGTSQSPAYVLAKADGTGSTIDLSALTGLGVQNGSLAVTNHGTVLDGKLTGLSGINVTLDGTGTLATGQWTSLTDDSVTVTGGSCTLANLVDFDGSSAYVQAGGSLTLPAVAGYANPYSNHSTYLNASGTGATLSLPALTSLGNLQSGLNIDATQAGRVLAPALASIAGTSQSPDYVIASTNGTGSTIDLSGLATLTLDTLRVTGGLLSLPGLTKADNTTFLIGSGAALNLPGPTAFTAAGATVTFTGSGSSIAIGSGILSSPPTSGTGTTIDVPAFPQGMSLDLPNNGTFSGGTTFNVSSGAIVNIQSGTYTGGVTFNVAQGATVDLTGGNHAVTYGGTLTGSGAGTVQLSNGFVVIAVGGLTWDFTGGLFQWIGGTLSAASGDATNLGTMNLSGPSDKTLSNDGTLDNRGTIIQTGAGDLILHSDKVSPTTLKIESDSVYLFQSDAGVNQAGSCEVDNAGTIKKIAGTGTSAINVSGALNNTGIIEADFGTLDLEPTSFAQISGGSLTGGTWNALSGASLKFPNGTKITGNAGAISLGGAGATIAALSGLASNSGSLSLTGGADLATSGDLSNSGSLTVGAGSMLSVGGNFTQTSAGSLGVQIGGTPASGQYGQVAVTGSAALDGTLSLSLVSGYTPTAGQSYPVMSFAQASGGFAKITGLPSGMTETRTANALDLNMPAAETDLAATSITAPGSAAVGQLITVGWQVKDQSPTAAAGSWQDSVYLSPTPSITGGSILLGRVAHNGGLGSGASYNGTLTAAVPALAPGSYYVLVQADSLDQVADPSRTNNSSAAPGQLAVSLPALTLGKAASGSFIAADQDHYYQVTVPAGGSLVVSATSAATSGALTLYISQGTMPTPYNYQEASSVPNQPSQTAVVPQVLMAGTYYVLVHSVAGAAATAGYTLTVSQGSTPTLSASSPASGGNAGNVTVEIDGTNLAPTDTASLSISSKTISASSIDFVNAGRIYATFNLSGAAIGSYALSIQQGGQAVTAPTPFQVVAAVPGTLNIDLSVPQAIRSGRTGTIVLSYTNSSSNDIVSPLLTISSTNPKAFFSTPDDPNDFVQSAQVLVVAPSGPAGILTPGESGRLTLTVLSDDTINNDRIPIQVAAIEPGQTIDWTSQEASLRPDTVPTAAWEAIWENLMAIVGPTTDSYNAALAQAATYLGGVGETPSRVSDVSVLWSFLVEQANGSFPAATLTSALDASLPTPGNLSLALDRTFMSTIAGRYQPGIFGLGWTTSWQTSVTPDSSGNVRMSSGGSLAYFVKQPNGSYLDLDGEFGTLTSSGGVYTFTATSGTGYVFLPSGLLNYEQDTNGNRITLGYDGQGRIIGLTYSNSSALSEPSESLTLSYNGQGLVSQVADGTGNTWAYSYDSAGHLLSVAAPGGLTTSYTYDTGSNPETVDTLLSITHPDGSHRSFTYDSQGRLSSTSLNGGANPITYTYGSEAEVTAGDAAGAKTTVWYNALGMAARVEDPLGGLSTYFYDNNGSLVSYTDAAGDTYQYAYDHNGNLTESVNPLGQTARMTYGSLSKLSSITEVSTNTIQYSYDAAGNLLSISYPDGTRQSFTYDPLGNMTETIEQNGDPIGYQYNAQGQVTQQSFADKTSETFAYDAHGNLNTAKTFAATGTLTGTTNLTYNAANELLSITYPNGQYLDFTYNAQGQRIKSVDQGGFTVNYAYDALGRLSKLTDGSDNLIVQYTYNNVGELAKKLNGNGTSTTYVYDSAGDLTNKVNLAPDGKAVNSSFTYTYNVLREVTSMTDASGNRTSYGYDATGQLTQITLPGGSTITYVYNAAGDRTEVISGGTTTSDSSNADNEITQVGSTEYTYDANGNLHTVTDPSGTTTYTYNDLNLLVSVTAPDGTVTRFQYSPLGFLAGEKVGGTQTNFLVDPTGLGNVMASYNGSGSLIAHYTFGFGLVSQTGPGGTGYYDFDASGNTVGITGSSGTYVNQYSYLPFGETTQVSAQLPNPFTFAGQVGVMQIGADLFYMRVRDYLPATGQFLSNDPLGLAGGDTNVRRYVANNPVTFVDPTGTIRDIPPEIPPENDDPNQGGGSQPQQPSLPPWIWDEINQGRDEGHGKPDNKENGTEELPDLEITDESSDSGNGQGGEPGGGEPGGGEPGGGEPGGGPEPGGNPDGGPEPGGSPGGGDPDPPNPQQSLPSVPNGQGHCFPPDTLVATEAGLRPIAQVEAGDRVWSYDFSSGVWRLCEVECRHDANYDGCLVALDLGAGRVSATAHHPIWVIEGEGLELRPEPLHVAASEDRGGALSGRWVNAQDVRQGDVVFLRGTGPIAIARIAKTHERTEVCNLTVGGLHNFTVGDAQLLVHNKIGLPPLPQWLKNLMSWDPNALTGPSGYGTQGFIQPAGAWSYTVDFENDGSVAAQDVTVTQQLDPSLDWATFQLGSFGFGSINITVPAGLTQYQTTVPYQNADGSSLNVQIDLNFNVQTGLLTVMFTSLDPITGQAPTGVTDGFLPPDNSSAIGEGYVQYTVRPKSGLATGTAINQQASVVFDINAPLSTAPVVNTIDVNTPTSNVAPLPATESSPSFTVNWSGSDGNGSGIATYDVYVSDDGGPYQLWQASTAQTSATYAGQPGYTYSFYSVATSNVGLIQPTPAAPQATTAVSAASSSPSPTPTPTPPLIIGEQTLFTRKLNKKHKPVGKPTLTGFRLDFSTAMNPATAGNAANYRVDWTSTKRVKKKLAKVLHAVPISVYYDAATRSVSLLLSGKQTFAKGGQITVIAAHPGGVSSAPGVLLDGADKGQAGDNGVFTILPKARGVARG